MSVDHYEIYKQVLFELDNQGVRLVPKEGTLQSSLVALFVGKYYTERVWTTLPSLRGGIEIRYPSNVSVPRDIQNYKILAHELVHVHQYRSLGVPRMAELYATKKGRVMVEAPAYAMTLYLNPRLYTTDVVRTLFRDYKLDGLDWSWAVNQVMAEKKKLTARLADGGALWI
jgi:hypothetical protein